jgi:hypothetical protein
MGLFRYIVQGFGWEIGSQAAREGLDALKQSAEPAEVDAETIDPRTRAKLERIRRHEEKRRAAQIDAQLAALKRRAKQS